ncbi:MAG: hypothetical protein CSA81_08265 [Acidobacteria bacterium]|nr:MAG: hypothetical protein CSA81_08265 [Acidobacteriota bacterium]PIE89719.1 MAG: hypothetical protein CR997_09800 [Acidobacteriota bacterium]
MSGNDRPLTSISSSRNQHIPDFPVKAWNQYELISFLGEGNMGVVFLARDKTLDRKVAIKFLSYGNLQELPRFKKEAVAQAQIEHECVCKVYEVGEVEGHHYIAMQYIKGPALHEAAQRMTLEEKLIVVRDAALGLHEAHRKGLIHRDVKPDNIMVELRDSGNWHPYVMDFGLVKEVDETGMTQTGMFVGTPMYMAPEQARGDRYLDRRTDVYGLGASLYEIISGEEPFANKSFFQLFQTVQHEMPTEMVKLKPEIPFDVQSITMKCMMKEQKDRYGSALELAQDINRYLDGEPIQARPLSLIYHLKIKMKKHRLAFSLVLVAAALILASFSWGIYTQWRAGQRETMIQAVSEKVEGMDGVLRLSQMLPVHPVENDYIKIERLMEDIRAMMREMGSTGKGPGNYALGKGYMALKLYEKAREHLELAWNSDYQDPRVAYALGQVLGVFYQRAQSELNSIEDLSLRRIRESEIENEFLKPAAQFLKQAQGLSIVAPEYLEAQLAYYQKDYDMALQKTRSAYHRLNWMHEALILEGDIYKTKGIERGHTGNYDEQTRLFELAEQLYTDSANLARSNLDSATRLIELYSTDLSDIFVGKKGDFDRVFEKGIASVERALKLSPDNPDLYLHKATFFYIKGEKESQKGNDPLPYWNTSLSLFEKILAKQESSFSIHMKANDLYRALYKHHMVRGKAEAKYMAAAEYHLKKAEELCKKSIDRQKVSTGFLHIGFLKMQKGVDPTHEFTEAINNLESIHQSHPDVVETSVNLGIAYFYLARYEGFKGKDPKPGLHRAIAVYQKAIELNPNYMASYNNLGETSWVLAEYEMKSGMDPTPTLRKAADAYYKGIELKDDFAPLYDGVGTTFLLIGTYEKEKGRSPWNTLKEAISSYKHSIEIKKDNPDTFINLAECYWIQAQYQYTAGFDPEKALKQAYAVYEQAYAMNPKDGYCLAHFADAYLIQAQYELENNIDNTRALSKAEDLLHQALEVNPNDYWVHLIDGKMKFIQTETLWKKSEPYGKPLAAAKRSLSKSVRINAAEAETHYLKARILAFEHFNQDRDEEKLELALQSTEQALDINPVHTNASILKSLLLFYSKKQTRDQVEDELRKIFEEQPLSKIHIKCLLNKIKDTRSFKKIVQNL